MKKVKVRLGDKVKCIHKFTPSPENKWGRNIPLIGGTYTINRIKYDCKSKQFLFYFKEIDDKNGFEVVYFEPVVERWVDELLDRIVSEMENDFEI